ncbi:MAG: disulfide bond formation protein B [Candidatus Doudnabacteria bacterium]
MKFLKNNSLYLAFATSLIATLGSFYFSNVINLPPCVLCWYQRIFMVPLAFILAVGILKKDKNLPYYFFPLSLAGLLISVYHNLLYFKILPEALSPCVAGVSCLTKFVKVFGFLDIPQLSFFGFLTINLLMLIYLKSKDSAEQN